MKIKYKGEVKWRGKERCWREGFFFFPLCFFLRSTKIGPQVFVGTKGKIDLRDESYVWTPKSWSFVKLHAIENFPTCVISSLKAI